MHISFFLSRIKTILKKNENDEDFDTGNMESTNSDGYDYVKKIYVCVCEQINFLTCEPSHQPLLIFFGFVLPFTFPLSSC